MLTALSPACKTPTLQKQLPVLLHLSSLWAIMQSTIRTHTQQKCIIITVLSFITCWEWPTWGHPCSKTIKWSSSCSLENLYRYRYPKKEKISQDRDLIDQNHTDWYTHKVKSLSFSFLILPVHTQSELPIWKEKQLKVEISVRLRQYTHKGTWSTWS